MQALAPASPQVAPAGRTLDVDNLTVRYGSAVAVDGVSLAIEPGEVVALLDAERHAVDRDGRAIADREVVDVQGPPGGRNLWRRGR